MIWEIMCWLLGHPLKDQSTRWEKLRWADIEITHCARCNTYIGAISHPIYHAEGEVK